MANIQQRGDASYLFTVSLPIDAKGRYPRETMTYIVEGRYTPKQLEEHLKHEYLKFKSIVQSGNYIRPQTMIFSEFVKEWDSKYASKLAATTYGNHLQKIADHISPIIGHMEMNKINELTLIGLLDNLTRKDGKEGDLSYHSKQDVYNTLQAVFKYAARWKVIKSDPMDGVDKPKTVHTEDDEDVQVYNEEEIAQLIELLQSELPHWRVMFTLALAAGLRRGELLGLEWKRVDFTKGQIEISTTVVLTRKGPLIKGTKSRSSRRVVTLPKSMMAELASYREQQLKDKQDSGDMWTEEIREWVFCNAKGGHMYPSSPTNRWSKFTKKHNFKYIRLHDLRHTSASILIAQGEHAKVISKRLGHSDISVTMNTYGHVFETANRSAGDKMESIFQPRSPLD